MEELFLYLDPYPRLAHSREDSLPIVDGQKTQCRTLSCSKKTFSETFFKEDKPQKMNRLMTLIVDLTESRSALGISKDLEELGVLVKKNSLCKYIGQKN